MRSKVQRLESSSACHATNLGDEGLGEKRALHLTFTWASRLHTKTRLPDAVQWTRSPVWYQS